VLVTVSAVTIAQRRPATMFTIGAALAAMLSLVTSAAGAAIPLKGPKTMRGSGYVAITLKGSTSSRLVVTSSGTRTLRFTDKNGNLSVRCTGGAKRQQALVPGAKKIVACVGKNAGANASGSQFIVTLDAGRYLAQIPRGYSGSYDLIAPKRTTSKEFVDCMREHGVTVTDPSQINLSDSTVQAALQACRQSLPPRP
jgi:hypothetical protein